MPAPLAFCAWFALVPLLGALEDRLAAGERGRALVALGYVFGLAFFAIGVHWVALLSPVAITVPWLRYPAWLAAAAYLAWFPALAVWFAGTLARRARAPLALVFPFAWLLIEKLRGGGELGFPWFEAGYSQQPYPPLIQLASLGGVSLVTLWVLAVNVGLWRATRGTRRARAAVLTALVLALPWAWGGWVLARAPQETGPPVALVQGNVAGEIKWSGKHQHEILASFLALSDSAAATRPRPALIVWPETATGSYLRQQLDQAMEMAAFATRTGIPVFSGFADYSFSPRGTTLYQNAAGLFLPGGGASEVYAKRHLVPFGERMPFQRLFPALGRIQLGQAEWTPGERAVLFPSAAGPFSCLICFEAIFPGLARADVRRGARWIVNITNDEWFGRSAALGQHAAMAVFRAVENHVPVARCANTGLTLVADAWGRVLATAPVWTPAVLVHALPAAGPPTPFTRWGDWPGALAALACAWWAVAALTFRGRGH